MVGSLLKFHFVYEKKNIFQGEEKESQRLLSVCVLFPGRRRTHPLSTWWLAILNRQSDFAVDLFQASKLSWYTHSYEYIYISLFIL